MNQPIHPTRRHWLLLAAGASLVGCASLPGSEPLKVAVVDVESLNGEGLEVRLMVKLRVQNSGDRAVDYDGISLDLDLRGMSFASGVSAQTGSVPRFGEAIVSVPVTISATAMLPGLMRPSELPGLVVLIAFFVACTIAMDLTMQRLTAPALARSRPR